MQFISQSRACGRILPYYELKSHGHMLGAYQDESYRVLKSTHGVTLLLNLPVYVMNMMNDHFVLGIFDCLSFNFMPLIYHK